MASKDRIYLVKVDETERLVRAANKSQAINHVARGMINAEVAEQDDLIRLAKTFDVEMIGEGEHE